MKKNVENIYEDILELSDLELQKRLWLNDHNDTGLISSYTEVNNRLFDDNSFDLFIDKEVFELGFSPALIVELDALRTMLNRYEQKKTDVEIINDPKWSEVSKQASLVINMWNNEINASTPA
jgi:hypothetical protein